MTLYEFLSENNFVIEKQTVEILEKILNNSRKAILLKGPAGVGKTQLTYLISKYLSSEYIFFQCTMGTNEDDLLYKYIPSEETKSGIKITFGPIPQALNISKNKKVILVLDEFDKTRPSADSLLLDLLQNFRISLYINDNETIISGNSDNLIIFLTSNDMREFSEPLLRRLAVITLNYLNPQYIFNLLSKQFSKEISILLTQIYVDTIKAGLRKPATIQELQQLGEILQKGVTAKLDDLLKIFIIKYDDDWQRFLDYIRSREPYKDFNFNFSKQENQESIEEKYEPNEQENEAEIQISANTSNNNEGNTQQIIQKLSRLTVKQKILEPKPIEIQEENKEVTLKIKDNNFDGYTKVIQALKPEPTDDPAKFGIFEMVKDEENYIISQKPLSLNHIIKLYNNIGKNYIELEAYAEDDFIVTASFINKLIDNATKIKYYTKNKIYLQKETNNNIIEKVVIDIKEDYNDVKIAKLIYYVKVNYHNPELPILKSLQYEKELDVVLKYLKVDNNKEEIILFDVYDEIIGEYKVDDIIDYDVIKILENATKLKSNNFKIYISINECNYNFYAYAKGKEITFGIGYNYAKQAGFTQPNEKKKVLANTDEAKQIVQQIRKALLKQ
jgi:MoxR-like ATPase